MIAGVPIGGGPSGGAPIGGGNYSGQSDIALLQSLLPGVHITSGGASGSYGGVGNPGSEWNSMPGQQNRPQGGGGQQGGNLQSSLGGQPIGQNQRAPGSIW